MMSKEKKEQIATTLAGGCFILVAATLVGRFLVLSNESVEVTDAIPQTTFSSELLPPIETTTELLTTQEATDVLHENNISNKNEQEELIDEEKLKLDIKSIQQQLHIPDKYMEIPEVLDLVTEVIAQNENYMLGFTATDLDEKNGTNKVRYSVDGNFSYNETYDQLIIFNKVDGQKHKINVDFYGQDSPYYITDNIVFDKDGNPLNNVIITSNGLDFNNFNKDYMKYTTSENYIEFDYTMGNMLYKLTMDDYEIGILITEKTNKADIKSQYRIKITDEYKDKITKAFNEHNHVEMRKILDELAKNNPVSTYAISEIVTSDAGNLNSMILSLDKNELDASLCEVVRIHYDTHKGSETYINYLDPYEFEYKITDEEEEELAKHILNGDCDSAVNYAKILDSKYKK